MGGHRLRNLDFVSTSQRFRQRDASLLLLEWEVRRRFAIDTIRALYVPGWTFSARAPVILLVSSWAKIR
jgi:hypothetical protein